MDWIYSIQKAISYIENNLVEDMNLDEIAQIVYSSNFHFQRIFSIITGVTLSEYIRNRRLTLAGQELFALNAKVIDVALKYRYESPESFAKAFARFHGITPSAAQKSNECLKIFSPFTINITIQGGFNMSRKIIANIPLITLSSNSHAYLNSFTGALYAAMKGLGEKWDYSELLALSGAGNRLCWTEGKWVWGNEQISNCGSHQFEYQDRVLSAIGWKYKNVMIERDEKGNILNISEDKIKQDIMDSIERGMPILAQGLIRGDRYDYAVFYGYENEGNTLIGWDYYQYDAELYVKENWITNLTGYVVFTEKIEPKTERERALDTFKAIATHARQGEIRGKKVGFAAWEALVNQLENDDFSKCSVRLSKDTPDDEHGINNLEHRFSIYCDTLCQIVERARPIGGEPLYFVSLIEKFPEWAGELTVATEAWQDCIDFCGNHGLGFSDEELERFRNHEVRKNLAFQLKCGMKKDVKAIEQIEKILERATNKIRIL